MTFSFLNILQSIKQKNTIMKTLRSSIKLLIILIISSCNLDEDSHTLNSTRSLKVIKKDYYTNNILTSSKKINFSSDKLINIQYNNGNYYNIYYEGDLVSKILEFNANNQLQWTRAYSYNSYGKLTQKKITPGPALRKQYVEGQKDIVYDGNLVTHIDSWSDGSRESKNITSFDNEGLILEHNELNAHNITAFQNIYEYQNDNIVSRIRKTYNTIRTEETYNYLDKKSSKEYRYIEYLFGSHWRINSFLDNEIMGLYNYEIYEVSDNYISNHYYFDHTTNISVTSTFSYEFDSNDYITKQTKNTNSEGSIYKTITTYEYE